MTFLFTPLSRISPWRPVFGVPAASSRAGEPGPWRPAVNLRADDETITVEAELPGVPEEALELTVVDDQLTLSGRRPAPADQGGRVLRRERSEGAFERIVPLPFPVDADQVEASLQHGVLTVRLPKAAAVRPRRIQVSAG